MQRVWNQPASGRSQQGGPSGIFFAGRNFLSTSFRGGASNRTRDEFVSTSEGNLADATSYYRRCRSPASTGCTSSGTSWTGSMQRRSLPGRLAPNSSPPGGDSPADGKTGQSALQRYFFLRNRSVFTDTTRSRKRTPSRWSISCWIATASNPIDSMILRSPSRPRASTSTHWARWTLAV